MRSTTRRLKDDLLRRWRGWGRCSLVLCLLLANLASLASILAPPLQAAAPAAPLAQSNVLTLQVVSARTEIDHPGGPVAQGDSIAEYEYLINIDNTGDPTQARADGCSRGCRRLRSSRSLASATSSG